MPAKEEVVETHQTYGLVGFSRISCGRAGINLFGSSIRHHSAITLRIRRAEKRRDLSRDWFHANEDLIEVTLSPTQFAEAITCMNMGDGVPCTIRYVGREDMGDCPEINQRQIFNDEIKRDVHKAMKDAEKLVSRANELLEKKSTNMTDKREIAETLRMLMQHIKNNIPFVHSQFNEAMDKTVNEAKGEVEAFFLNKINSLGLEALQDHLEHAMLPRLPDTLQIPNSSVGGSESPLDIETTVVERRAGCYPAPILPPGIDSRVENGQ